MRALAATLLVATCAEHHMATTTPATPTAAQPDAPLRYQLTYYYVADEHDFDGLDRDTTVEDPMCTKIANVSADFFRALTIEGTGRLADGRVINYSGLCLCVSPCYYEVDHEHPYGVGVEARPLAPFRSVAVDPEVIRIGESLYVPELDGVEMPGQPPWGGFVHDGCVIADDRGGHIRGRHIDFFATTRSSYLDLDGRLHLREITVIPDHAKCRTSERTPL
jgi:3D (Asp-Asp-Asp) domain-containing protein